MCGPTGIGALLVQPETFEEMQPFMGGGDMIETVTTEGSTYQTNEHKFEAGTPLASPKPLDGRRRWIGWIPLIWTPNTPVLSALPLGGFGTSRHGNDRIRPA